MGEWTCSKGRGGLTPRPKLSLPLPAPVIGFNSGFDAIVHFVHLSMGTGSYYRVSFVSSTGLEHGFDNVLMCLISTLYALRATQTDRQ